MRLFYENIYISNLGDAGDKRLLKKHNIKVVLNVANDCDTPFCDAEITYTKWGLDDPKDGLAKRNEVRDAAAVLSSLVLIAKKRNGNVLIHCIAGNNRSALVAAVWMQVYRDIHLSVAVGVAQVKDKKNWMIDKGFNW